VEDKLIRLRERSFAMGVGVLRCRAISTLTCFLDRFDSDVDNCSDIEYDACECMNDVVFADSR
jgi:hypothetical protein